MFLFVLTLLENFAQEKVADPARKCRLAMLQQLGFGNEGEFAGNPVGEIRRIREVIMANPFYKPNTDVRDYFGLLDRDMDSLVEAHPLLLYFNRFTTVLSAVVDEDPDSKDILADQRLSEQARGWTYWIKQTVPAWMLTGITTYLISPLSSAFWAKIQNASEVIIKTFSDWLGHLLVGAG